jgi:hypothetical protein
MLHLATLLSHCYGDRDGGRNDDGSDDNGDSDGGGGNDDGDSDGDGEGLLRVHLFCPKISGCRLFILVCMCYFYCTIGNKELQDRQ